jgi:hypothetical protein
MAFGGRDILSTWGTVVGRDNEHLVSLATWIWVGDIRIVAALSCVSRGSPWSTRMSCIVCGPTICEQRRIVLPEWETNFDDLLEWNGRCYEHSRVFIHQYGTVFMPYVGIDPVVRTSILFCHRRECMCDICRNNPHRVW